MQDVIALPMPYTQAMAAILGRSSAAARPAITAAPLATAATNSCGTTEPPEIVALANSLKNSPDLIYEWVYDNVDTLPQYGSLKGPLGALIDRSGTSFDQAELMIHLLQQAGNCTASFEVGEVNVTAAQLAAWVGVNTSLDNNLNGIEYIIGSGGFPGEVDTNGSGQVLGATLGWAWVEVQINGTNYVFDPATLAKYNPTPAAGLGAALPTALGYSQSTFISDAETGASIGSTSISGLNRAQLRSDLTTYASNLVSYLKANDPSFGPTDVIGGRTIVPLTPNTQQRVTSLSYQNGTPTNYTISSFPTSLRTQLSLTLPGASAVTFNSSDLDGQRLTLDFNSSLVPTPELNGTTEATGSAQSSGAQVTVTASLTHPYANYPTNTNSCLGAIFTNCSVLHVTVAPNAVFVIGNGWGRVSRAMIERHRQLLAQAVAANPGNPNAEAVLGESLVMLGDTWLAEYARVQQLSDAFAGTSTTYQHAVGIVGMKPVGTSTGPYVDLPINLLGVTQVNNRTSASTLTPSESAAFFADAETSSVLESGSIEQTQTGVTGASTVKVLDTWAQSGGTVFDINNSAVTGDDLSYYTSTIRPQLVSTYGAQDLCTIDVLVGYSTPTCNGGVVANPTWRVIAPSNGAITIGQWSGTGYFQVSQDGTTIGAIITGGLSGGEPASPDPTPSTNSIVTIPPSSNSTVSTAPGLSLGNSGDLFGSLADPLNQVTGDYQYSHDDITVGSQKFPYGLGFQRSYDSGRTGTSPLGTGWTDNFNLSAQTESDGFEGMAATSPENGAVAIAAIYVLQDILNEQTSTAKPLDRTMVAVEIERFLMDQLTNNAIQVIQPGLTESYVLQPNGTYTPPLGSAATVSESGGTVTYTEKDGTELTFDNSGTSYAAGNITSWSNPAGMTVNFTYTNGLLSSVSNNLGRTLTLAYNGDNQIQSVSDGNGRSVSYAYTGNDLTGFTDALGNLTTFAYDTSGTYDTAGHLTQVFYPSHPSSAFVTNYYDGLGRVYEQKNGNGDATLAYFAGSRTEIDNPAGNATIVYFDPLGRTLLSIDGVGNQTIYRYDGQERLVTKTLPEGNSFSYTYDLALNVLSETQAPKPGALDLHPPGTNLLQPRTRSWTYACTGFNEVCTATDFLGNVTTYGYNTQGELISLTEPAVSKPGVLGTHQPVYAYTYESHGLRISETDPEGRITTYGYDGGTGNATVGNLTSMTVDSGRLNLTTRYAYDAIGNRTGVTDGNGNTTSYNFDAQRQLIEMTPPAPYAADVTEYGYDPEGRPTCVQRAVSGGSAPCTGSGGKWQTTKTTYTPTGQVASTTDPSGNTTTYTYDGADRPKNTISPQGYIVSNAAYDADNRVTVISKGLSGALTDVEGITYTPNGLIANRRELQSATVTNRTVYTSDGFDRLGIIGYVNGTSHTFAYTLDDDPDYELTEAGQTITRTYDALNRVLSKTGDPDITYGYDYDGRVLSETTPVVSGEPWTGAWTIAYDTAGRRDRDGGSDGKVVKYAYDAAGNRIYVYYPDGLAVHTIYDNLERAYAIGYSDTRLATDTFDALSRVSAIAYGTSTGFTTTDTYAGTDTLISQILQDYGSAGSATYGYTYNAARQVASESQSGTLATLSGSTAATYTISQIDRITSQTIGAGSPASFKYDLNGDLLSDGTRTYTYDQEGDGRVLTATASGLSASYGYDRNRGEWVTLAGMAMGTKLCAL